MTGWWLALAIVGCAAEPQRGAIDQAIFGGETVAAGGPIARSTVMFVVQGGDGQHGCSASLIDAAHALTAAHCLIGLQPGDQPELVLAVKVTAGAGPRRTVTSFVAFDSGFDEDIAVLRFAGGLPAGYEPVALAAPSLSLAPGAPLVLAGYGQTTAAVNDRGTLRAAASQFAGGHGHRYEATAPGAGLCSGDSGGPDYVANGATLVQLGVHVSGDCATSATSSDVRAYQQFIDSTGASPIYVDALDPPAAGDAGAGSAGDAGSANDPLLADGGGCGAVGLRANGLVFVAFALGLVLKGRRR